MRSRTRSALIVAGGTIAMTIGDAQSAPKPPVTYTAVAMAALAGSSCVEGLVGNVTAPLKGNQTKQHADALEWIVANGCTSHYAVLCVYRVAKKPPHPLVADAFHRCDPPDTDIGKPFQLGKDDIVRVECRALSRGHYKKAVQRTQTEQHCAPTISDHHERMPASARTHTLDLAIEP